MPRTVVPPPPANMRDRERDRGGAEYREHGDSLPERLIKYVPGETLAFFVPAAALIGSSRDAVLVIAIVIAAAGTVGYLWLTAPNDPAEKPLVHFYALAVLAFLCWAVGTTPSVADLVHADDTLAGLILLAAVFLIPFGDAALNRLQGRASD